MSDDSVVFPTQKMVNSLQNYVDGTAQVVDIVAAWAKRKGWWADGRTVGDNIALMHSELSEALEAFRKVGLLATIEDGKPEGVASELADVLIRIYHFCAENEIDIASTVMAKMIYNETREYRHGNKKL